MELDVLMPEDEERELREAGWRKLQVTGAWLAPWGRMYQELHVAWNVMQLVNGRN